MMRSHYSKLRSRPRLFDHLLFQKKRKKKEEEDEAAAAAAAAVAAAAGGGGGGGMVTCSGSHRTFCTTWVQ